MSDPFAPQNKERDVPTWGLYQRENFWKPNDGEVPLFNTRQFYHVFILNIILIFLRSRQIGATC